MNSLPLDMFDAPAGSTGARASLLLGGDLCPIGRYERKLLAGQPIFDDPLLQAFAQADVTLINLEAPLCAAGTVADSPSGSGLRADPRVAAALQAMGVDLAGLANNHIRDFGDEGVGQTMQALDSAGIGHVGAGMTLHDASRELRLEVNSLSVAIVALAERELNVASPSRAGSSWFRPEADARRIAALRAEVDFILVYLHAGHEFTTAPSPRIRQACRDLVDAGADAVIAHHPHVIQGAERYRDALIAYSLGNLVFDSAYVSAYEGTDIGYLVDLKISRRRIEQARIIPYRLRPEFIVGGLDPSEFDMFVRKWPELCALIVDEDRFARAWEENVIFRWRTEYGRIMRDFSKHFCDVNHKDYARRTGNLFSCPTHVEMIESAMALLERGRINRL